MKAIVLAAGLGSRLGFDMPKAMVNVSKRQRILDIQLEALNAHIPNEAIFVVVGYKRDLIIDAYPALTYVYNDKFGSTNTSQSLRLGLSRALRDDVIWLNGDVYLDKDVISRVVAHNGNCIAVNNSRVADEEVKYTLNANGTISAISKTVENGLGEAVGVNKVTARDVGHLYESLRRCQPNDYFEAGIESILVESPFRPIDVSDSTCIEVDFLEDLLEVKRCNRLKNVESPSA